MRDVTGLARDEDRPAGRARGAPLSRFGVCTRRSRLSSRNARADLEASTLESALAEALRAGAVAEARIVLRGAQRRLTAALVDQPGRPELYFWRARVRHALGASQAAALDYTMALARGYTDAVDVLLRRARLHADRGDARRAEQDLSEAVVRAPYDRRGYEARSLIRFVRGDHEGAIADITAAIDLAPDRPSGYYDRSAYLMALDRVDEAATDFGRAVALDPSFVDDRAASA